MHYCPKFAAAVERLYRREMTLDEFVRAGHDDRVVYRALLTLRMYSNAHVPSDKDDLYQIGMLELARRVGLIEPPEGKKWVWDPAYQDVWPLGKYVEWGVGAAMKEYMNTTLRFRKGVRGPHSQVPSASVSGDPAAAARWGETVHHVDVAGGDSWSSLGPGEMEEMHEACQRPDLGHFERVLLTFAVAAVTQGYTLSQVCAAVAGDPMYGGVSAEGAARVLLRYAADRDWRRQTIVTDGKPSIFDRMEDMKPEQIVAISDDINTRIDAIRDSEQIEQLGAAVSQAYHTFVRSTLHLAQVLWRIDREELWAIGDRYRSFNDFLQNGSGVADEVSTATAYKLVQAYEQVRAVADERGLAVEDVWTRIQRSKLNLIAAAPEEIRGALVDAGLSGASRSEMEEMVQRARDQVDVVDADVVEEVPTTSAEQSSDAVLREAEPDEVLSVYARVMPGRDVYVSLRDKETDDVVAGVPEDRLDETYFRTDVGERASLSGTFDVQGGKMRRVVLRWDPKVDFLP